MQSYRCLRKNARPTQQFFCQHVSTLNKKKHLISCEDERRTRKIAEHLYATFVTSHQTNHNCKKNAQNEPTRSSLKRIISSYLLRKIKKIKKANNSTGNEVAKESTHPFRGLPESRSYTDVALHSLHRRFYPSQKYLLKNGPTLNHAHHHFSYTHSTRKRTTPQNSNSSHTSNRNIGNGKNEERHHDAFLPQTYANCNGVVYPTYYPLQRRIANKCLHRYASVKWFGTNVGEESEKKRVTSKEGSQSEWGAYRNDHTASESPTEGRTDEPPEEYEKLKIKELENILNNLEKINANKNSKININIKILVYVFKNFIYKNKELKTKIFFSFIFLVCSKISIIYTPILLSSFIENVNLEKSLNPQLDGNLLSNNSSVMILLAYVFSRILSSSLNELRNSVFNTISQRISTYVSKLFFYKIHNLKLSYILSKKNGELSFIFNRGCKSITNLLNVLVFQVIPIIIEFLLYLYILTYKIHYSVSLVTCFNMFLYIVFTTLVTKRRTIIRKFMNKSEQNTFNIFLDSIQNVEQVKYYTNEMHELKKFIKEQKKYEREAINVQKSLSLLNFGQQIILNFNLFLCLYLTYINIANDVFPFSYLILVNTLLFQLAMPLNMFGTIYRETKLSLVDIECMIRILVKKIQSPDYSNKLKIKTGNVKFENVSFKYPVMEESKDSDFRTSGGDNQDEVPPKSISKLSRLFKTMRDRFFFPKNWLNAKEQPIAPMKDEIKDNLKNALRESVQTMSLTSTRDESKSEINQKENNYIFQNFTCNIENGEKVAIIGKSGLGKSTLIKLLLKFYDINSGNIYIDNKNIENINLYTLRKNISVVPQDTILFNNTISYNIKYGNFQCTDKQMIDACIQSELHEKILQMDKQYDTLVGERGTKLSIGEKQRICIARCFLKNSKIIVLDEHASNLDNENKKSIEKALHKLCLGKTTFIITHMMENLQFMDKIIFFSGNNIFVGNHKELMTANPSYREFFNSKNNQSL
ncbi:ABC transporter, putative [Plasmodium knowlesi strain H]|uniref:ABC transporter, putative n=3 Tax=Plasmodium knowlesi TaxID=5850 RepID=A0A5K1UIU2_PLAKH|nr:ABC transporter B family member 6, putative [Plasmodium knowlesi strain H]OTN66254.1 putative ABC transporter [Plasmodium knowlesi]CAA9989814.1 ABC transporter B family member 6, putative [Plasmodium knowlesi strain H]SBO24359.1 ABC transporter, putative [Plasmodium knowlesi strain H]SBO26678.1 ABC transporter, putative [Plasmodium knowlesi strain H]VVS79288.1 ABC transporter B family member 6, putative [Plasmodium knowlesi strain H]|eukprot:XP_002259829.1 ABC transporter, putative [Plasmodium knowlesi strain H]